jgi:hypothetical protein
LYLQVLAPPSHPAASLSLPSLVAPFSPCRRSHHPNRRPLAGATAPAANPSLMSLAAPSPPNPSLTTTTDANHKNLHRRWRSTLASLVPRCRHRPASYLTPLRPTAPSLPDIAAGQPTITAVGLAATAGHSSTSTGYGTLPYTPEPR